MAKTPNKIYTKHIPHKKPCHRTHTYQKPFTQTTHKPQTSHTHHKKPHSEHIYTTYIKHITDPLEIQQTRITQNTQDTQIPHIACIPHTSHTTTRIPFTHTTYSLRHQT